MANFHPETDMLIEFSAGTLPASVSVCVATHLEYCVQCRNQVAKFDNVGGGLLMQANPLPLGTTTNANQAWSENGLDASLDRALAAIDNLPADNLTNDSLSGHASHEGSAKETGKSRGFPQALAQLLPGKLDELVWSKISASLSIARLAPGDRQRELALHKLRSGGGVADHDHRGEEITVVIQGSFSDQSGLYTPGDFLVRQPGEVHSPKASHDGDCICLSAMAAPVKFTGMLTRLINPFLKVMPSG